MAGDSQGKAARSGDQQAAVQRGPFYWGCEQWSLDPARMFAVFKDAAPAKWAGECGGGVEGGSRVIFLALAAARIRCAEGNHQEEARLGLATVRDVEPRGSYSAWLTALAGVAHQLRECEPDRREELANALSDLAHNALADLDERLIQPGAIAPSKNHQLDEIVSHLAMAEAMLGFPASELSEDLSRRLRSRKVRKRAGKQRPFFNKHRDGLVTLWDEHREGWFRARFLEKLGQPAPEIVMQRCPQTRTGWQMRPEFRQAFEPEDYRAFRRDMEERYRQNEGLPAKGEGWVSQTHLANCVRGIFPDLEVVLEASPSWLGRQRLDIFIPALSLAIEYQGEQHFLPLDHWGSDAGLSDRKVMDAAKRKACETAGVTLVEWHYATPITPEAVRARLISVISDRA